MDKNKIGEASNTILFQHYQQHRDEVGDMHQKMKIHQDPDIDAMAAPFVHMVMMHKNNNPADQQERVTVINDGIRRYNDGEFIIEKKDDEYEIFLRL